MNTVWKTQTRFFAGVLMLSAAGATYAQEEVTFSKDVAPILQENCHTCHRPGQMAPMALMTYEQVRPWAPVIKARVEAREMPPWHLDKTVGIQRYDNDVSLSDEEIATIAAWVDLGAPQGNPEDLPAPIDWPSDDVWRLAEKYGREPDLIVRSTPWTQSAQGQDLSLIHI